MNKKSLAFLTLLFFFLDSQTQQIYFGFRGGLSMFHVTESAGTLSASYDTKIGPNFGLNFEIAPSNNFSIQPELAYNSRGYKMEASSLTGGISINATLNYLELPIMLKGKLPIENLAELYLEAGPSIAYGIGGNVIVNNVPSGNPFQAGGFNKFDYGINFGVGSNFKIVGGAYKLGLGFRIYRGMGELYPSNPRNISGKNNGMMLTLNFGKGI